MKTLFALFFAFFSFISYSFGQRPVIHSFAPKAAVAGSQLKISGANFNPQASENVVWLGAVRAEVIAASATELSIKVPASGGHHSIMVSNKANGLSASSSSKFNVSFNRKEKFLLSDLDIESEFKAVSGSGVKDIYLKDMGNDGKPDLVTLSGDNPLIISIFPNASTAGSLHKNTFSTAITLSPGEEPERIVVADMDGDGKQDILVSRYYPKTMFMLKNNVLGNDITAASFTRIDLSIGMSYSFAVGDINLDGRPDMVMASNAGLSVYLNTSKDHTIHADAFKTAVSYPLESIADRIILADLDEDGRPEIVLSGMGFSIYHNQVENQQLNENSLVLKKFEQHHSGFVSLADFNQDGKQDLAFAMEPESALYVYENLNPKGELLMANFRLKAPQYIGPSPSDIYCADFDGDGRPDLLTVSEKNLYLHKNSFEPGSPDAPWFNRMKLPNVSSSPKLLLAEDLNADGTADVLMLNKDGSIAMRKNKELLIPSIQSISPVIGPSGTIVTITGKNFGPQISDNLVLFGSRPAKIVELNENYIKVASPEGATYGHISVANKISGRRAASTRVFKTTFGKGKDLEGPDFRRQSPFPDNNIQTRNTPFFVDLDGDGFLDLCYLNENAKMVVHKNSAQKKAIDCNTFGPAIIIDKGNYTGFNSADLDGDGLWDIMAFGNNEAFFLKNITVQGKIQFKSPIPGLYTAQYADIDGDGLADAGGYRNVSNEHTADFAYKEVSSLTGSPVDMDGDGKLDLLSLNDYGVSLKLSKTEPGFWSDSSFVEVLKDRNLIVYEPVLVDLNHDGRTDFIAGNHYYKTTIDANGGFNFEKSVLIADLELNSKWESLGLTAIRDLNGDGQDELLKVTVGDGLSVPGSVMIYQNRPGANGLPGFKTALTLNSPRIRTGQTYGNELIAVEDLNNDDKPDLVVWESPEQPIVVYENVSVAQLAFSPPEISQFSPAKASIGAQVKITGKHFNPVLERNAVFFGQIKAKLLSGSTTELLAEVPAAAVYGMLSVLDLDSKLRAFGKSAFAVQQGDGKGHDFTASSFVAVPGVMPQSNDVFLTAADLDGDQIPELISGNQRISIHRSSQRDAQGRPALYQKESSLSSGFQTLTEDLDGDGKLDLISSSNTSVHIYENNNNLVCKLNLSAYNLERDIISLATVVGDVNRDGKPDLMVAMGWKEVVIYLNQSRRGSISFSPFKRISLPISGGNSISHTFMIKDMDGDGLNDLICGAVGNSRDFKLDVYRNLTVAGSDELEFEDAYSIQVREAQDLKCDDFDGDGKPDFVLAADRELIFFQNLSSAGQLKFGNQQQLKLEDGSRNVNVGDFDGDGKPDLVITWDTGGLAIFRNKASKGILNQDSFSAATTYHLPGTHWGTVVLDLNQDGKADLLIPEATAGQVTYLENRGTGGMSFQPSIALENTSITIKGENFGTVEAVSFGGVPAKSFSRNSASSITAVVGKGASGEVAVVHNGQKITAPGFVFVPQPVLTASGKLGEEYGSSVELTVSPEQGFDYIWTKDETELQGGSGARRSTTEAGTYQATIKIGGVIAKSNKLRLGGPFTLPADNFKIAVTAASCKGSPTGEIRISAGQQHPYQVELSSASGLKRYEFRDQLSISNLAAGRYNICVTLPSEPEYKRCFELELSEPEALSVYASVKQEAASVQLQLSGGSSYQIALNGKEYRTTASSIELPLNKGANSLSVSTALECQGTISKLLVLEEKISVYPNPFEKSIEIDMAGDESKSVQLKVYNSAGTLVYSRELRNAPRLSVDLATLEPGLYILNLKTDKSFVTSKIIKK